MGYRFVSIGADVLGLNEYCKGIVAASRQKATP
jgi:hypothetical protein